MCRRLPRSASSAAPRTETSWESPIGAPLPREAAAKARGRAGRKLPGARGSELQPERRSRGAGGQPPAWTRAQQQPRPPPAGQAPGAAAGARRTVARVPNAGVRWEDRRSAPRGAALPEPCGPSSELWRLSTAGRCTCCPEPCARCPPFWPLLASREGNKGGETLPDSCAGPRGLNSAAATWLQVRSGSEHPLGDARGGSSRG